MSTATLKRQLEKTIKATRSQLQKIEESERDQRNKAFVGRYFRYQNCYSCPEKPSDYWWMYLRVIGLKDGGLVVGKFQTDTSGNLRLEPHEYLYEMLAGCKEITQQQYERAFGKAIADASVVVE